MTESATEKVEDVAEEGKEKVSGNGNGDSLAKKFLIPAAAGVGTIAAGYAAKKVPDLFRDQVMPKVEDRGSDEAAKMGKQAVDKMKDESGLTGKVAGAVAGKMGGGDRRRRQEDAPAADPALHRRGGSGREGVQGVDRLREVPAVHAPRAERREDGNTKLKWREKIWFSTREWEGKITDRRKNERIAWKTTSGTQHSGIVSFHKIGDNLTRVMVTVDFHPTGMLEKMASGLRFAKRAVEADLARFKAYVEMQDAKALEYGNDKGDDDASDDKSSSGQVERAARRARPTGEQERKQRAERRKQRQA